MSKQVLIFASDCCVRNRRRRGRLDAQSESELGSFPCAVLPITKVGPGAEAGIKDCPCPELVFGIDLRFLYVVGLQRQQEIMIHTQIIRCEVELRRSVSGMDWNEYLCVG